MSSKVTKTSSVRLNLPRIARKSQLTTVCEFIISCTKFDNEICVVFTNKPVVLSVLIIDNTFIACSINTVEKSKKNNFNK